MRIMLLKNKVEKMVRGFICRKHAGIDGILVTVGLCIIALLICVVMKDELSAFIKTIVSSLTSKATGILGT